MAREQTQPSAVALGSIRAGKRQRPPRVVAYGTEGIGKSTFGAGFPAPVFVATEQFDHLDVPGWWGLDWPGVLGAVRALERDAHDYRTLVVDTLDWLEPLIFAHVCRRDGKSEIEDYGYRRGYATALEEWRLLLAALEVLHERREMGIVLIAHAVVRPFHNPAGEDYDRFTLKISPDAAGLVKEWADCVLFAAYEEFAAAPEPGRKVKGVSTGARFLWTQRRAAYDAKNRYSLPERLPLDYAEFAAAVARGQAGDPASILAELAALAKDAPAGLAALVTKEIDRANGDASRLSRLVDRLRARLAEVPKA